MESNSSADKGKAGENSGTREFFVQMSTYLGEPADKLEQGWKAYSSENLCTDPKVYFEHVARKRREALIEEGETIWRSECPIPEKIQKYKGFVAKTPVPVSPELPEAAVFTDLRQKAGKRLEDLTREYEAQSAPPAPSAPSAPAPAPEAPSAAKASEFDYVKFVKGNSAHEGNDIRGLVERVAKGIYFGDDKTGDNVKNWEKAEDYVVKFLEKNNLSESEGVKDYIRTPAFANGWYGGLENVAGQILAYNRPAPKEVETAKAPASALAAPAPVAAAPAATPAPAPEPAAPAAPAPVPPAASNINMADLVPVREYNALRADLDKVRAELTETKRTAAESGRALIDYKASHPATSTPSPELTRQNADLKEKNATLETRVKRRGIWNGILGVAAAAAIAVGSYSYGLIQSYKADKARAQSDYTKVEIELGKAREDLEGARKERKDLGDKVVSLQKELGEKPKTSQEEIDKAVKSGRKTLEDELAKTKKTYEDERTAREKAYGEQMASMKKLNDEERAKLKKTYDSEQARLRGEYEVQVVKLQGDSKAMIEQLNNEIEILRNKLVKLDNLPVTASTEEEKREIGAKIIDLSAAASDLNSPGHYIYLERNVQVMDVLLRDPSKLPAVVRDQHAKLLKDKERVEKESSDLRGSRIPVPAVGDNNGGKP